jgi:hypothetical protein
LYFPEGRIDIGRGSRFVERHSGEKRKKEEVLKTRDEPRIYRPQNLSHKARPCDKNLSLFEGSHSNRLRSKNRNMCTGCPKASSEINRKTFGISQN